MEPTRRAVATLLTAKLARWGALRDRGVWVAAGIYAVVFTALSIYRFSLMGDCYDLSVFEQSFWSTVNEGLPLYNSQEGPEFGRFSHLAEHVAPFLFLLTPFYWLWQGPEALLLAKTVALALGAVPLYKLATALLGSRESGWLVVVIYLLYPPLHGVNLWGFHENDFAVAPLMLLLLCYVRRSWALFWISLVAVLAVKESMALTTAAFGLYLLFFRREWRLGLSIAAISLCWLFIAQWIVIPFAQGTALFEMDARQFIGRYDPIVGQNYGEILWNIVRHPVRIADYAFADPEKRTYLFQLFFPLAFVPLAAPGILLISAPVLAQNLLSAYRGQHAILAQYSAEIIPFLFYGLCLGIARIERWWGRWRSEKTAGELTESGAPTQTENPRGMAVKILAFVFAAVLVANLISGVWSFALGQRDFLLAIAKAPERRKAALEFIAAIPKDASVMSDVSMISHLGGRAWLHLISREAFRAREWDYVLLDLRFPWAARDITPNEVIRALRLNAYQVTVVEDIVLFKRPGASERQKK